MNRRPAIVIATTLLAASALAACGRGVDDTAAPPRYGDSGACWYVDDPSEVLALRAAGYCPVNWAPAPMPIAWRSQYAWYYDSPRYYDHYVSRERRTTYVTHVKVYEKANPAAVRTPPKATRTSSSVKPAGFNSGSGRQGGDNAPSSSRPRPSFNGKPPAGAPRPSYTSRPASGGSSFRGGSRR